MRLQNIRQLKPKLNIIFPLLNISKLSSKICNRLNRINPKTPEEYAVIKYGMELFGDNVTKFCFLIMVGFIIGKVKETFIILFTFCMLRLQAGGRHAKNNISCTLDMILLWGLSLVASRYIVIGIPILVFTFIVCATTIILWVPQSINIKYFTSKVIIRKKVYSFLLLCISLVISAFCYNIRMLIVFPIILETLTLIPINNISERGVKNEQDNC